MGFLYLRRNWTKMAAIFLVFSFFAFAGSRNAAAMTNQVVLFTGFLSTPGSGTGMDLLDTELSTIGIPDYEGMVFSWSEKQEAFDWIQQHESDRTTLVLIGHSFGGHSVLQLANDFLKPSGVNVDLTVQIESVENFGVGSNDQLPTNVDVGINYFQISTGFFEPQGEDEVQGATNVNVEVLFNDTSITHTSIDNDPRLHALIGQNILDNLNQENADFDSDGIVGGADFLVWQRGFGMIGTAVRSSGDANGDMDVNGEDLVVWQQQFGNSGPLFSAALPIPEPSTGVLAGMLAALGVFAVRGSGRVWYQPGVSR